MKPPLQTFDVTPMVRFRIRGTQEQIVKVHGLLVDIAQERVREGSSAKFSTALGSSGPSNSDNAKQWAMSFYTSGALMNRVRDFLFTLGLDEEL